MISFLFILAVFVLSVDVFLASTIAGFLLKKTNYQHLSRLLVAFGLVAGVASLLGVMLGRLGTEYFSQWANWYAATIIFLLALKLFYDGLRMHKVRQAINPLDNAGLVALTVMVAINSLFTGIGFGLLSINYLYVWYVVLMNALAILLGYYAGFKIKKLISIRIGLLSAIIFLLMAIVISIKL